MKKFLVSAAMLSILHTLSAQAQEKASATKVVADAKTKQAIAGAALYLPKSKSGTLTDLKGQFSLKKYEENEVLRVSALGYETQLIETSKLISLPDTIFLVNSGLESSTVVVEGINTDEKGAFAYTNVKKSDIAAMNFAQDIPYLLQLTPSTVASSDAGNGVGYTGLRIRGSDNSRINVTVNGIPINEAESQGLFWVNMPDLASSADAIQIQRGVGTSTNGAAAFGGSINIQTDALNKEAYGEVANSYGSFNTRRHTIKAGTGLLNNRFAFDARLSRVASDGFVDRAFSDMGSYYLSGGYYGKKTTVKFIHFSGRERTYQSWNGVPAEIAKQQPTFNSFTYDNQTDNYRQDHHQLHLNHNLGNNWEIGGALYYTRGRGYFEEAQFLNNPFAQTELSRYGLPNVTLGAGSLIPGTRDTLRNDSTFSNTDLVRRKWLDNHLVGSVFTLKKTAERYTFILGGGYNQYKGQHFGELIWARLNLNGNLGDKYYNNFGLKTDFNLYSKLNYDITNRLSGFIDVQVRQVGYNFEGFNQNGIPVNTSVNMPMFNPKAGFNYLLNNNDRVYASYSVAHREPNRNDFVDNPIERRPQVERLQDLELGYRRLKKNYSLGANFYYMYYTNQLVLTGAVNDVGEAVRTNVGKSYRMGIELEGSVNLTNKLQLAANFTASDNQVIDFTEIIYGYSGPDDYIRNTFSRAPIAYSPNFIGAALISYKPFGPKTEFVWQSKYVGEQFLDNTGNQFRRLDAFFVNDVRVNQTVFLQGFKKITFGLMINNIFDSYFVNNGYTFSDRNTDGSINTYNFYFPQAGINVMGNVVLSF